MNKNLIKEAIDELHTINDFVRWGVSRFEEAQLFYGHGTDNAFDEAISLVLHAIHLPIEQLQRFKNTNLTNSEKILITNRIVQRVKEHKPVAYINKEAWFAGMNFFIDERVLIPRSPLAELIKNDFSPWLDNIEVRHIVDVGTGSGCIACACAQVFPSAFIDAIDISAEALEVAKHNVEAHGLETRVNLYQSDLFADVPPKMYQLIISNPPYVDKKSMNVLPKEYHYEPSLSLAAGADGLSVVIPLLKQALDRITPDGVIIIEVGFSEAALAQKFPTIDFIWLELHYGGQGVFLLTAQQLFAHRDEILRA